MRKVHIGKAGPGSVPRCGRKRFNGISASLAEFEQAALESRCSQCAKHLPTLQQMRAQKLEAA